MHLKNEVFTRRYKRKRLCGLCFERFKPGLEGPVYKIHLPGVCSFAIDGQRIAAGKAARTEIVAVKPDRFHERIERDVVERGSSNRAPDLIFRLVACDQ